jgi:hypothetical protein
MVAAVCKDREGGLAGLTEGAVGMASPEKRPREIPDRTVVIEQRAFEGCVVLRVGRLERP